MFTRIRKDIRRLHPFILPTIASISIFNFGWGFADPFFSLYLSTFTSQYALIGTLNTLYVALAVILLVPLGKLLDTTNHHAINNTAKLGYVIVATLYFFAGKTLSMPLLITALLTNGIVTGLVWSTTGATLRQFSRRDNSSFVFGLYYTARNVSWAIALFIAIMIVQYVSLYQLFIPVILCALLAVLPTLHLVPTHAKTLWQGIRALEPVSTVQDFIRDLKMFRRELWVMYALLFVSFTIQLFWLVYIPLYVHNMGFSFSQVGLLCAINSLPFIFSFVFAELSDRSERLRNVLIGFLLSGIAMALLTTVPHTFVWLMILGFCSMTGYAMILPSVNAVITLTAPAHLKGRASSFTDFVMFWSLIICSPIIGRSIDVLGWGSTFLCMGTLMVMVGALVLVLKEHWLHRNILYTVNHPTSKKLPYTL